MSESPAAYAFRAMFNQVRLLAGEPLLPPGAVAAMSREEFDREMFAASGWQAAVAELPVPLGEQLEAAGGYVSPSAQEILTRLSGGGRG